jgi:hypothetical protein
MDELTQKAPSLGCDEVGTDRTDEKRPGENSDDQDGSQPQKRLADNLYCVSELLRQMAKTQDAFLGELRRLSWIVDSALLAYERRGKL